MPETQTRIAPFGLELRASRLRELDVCEMQSLVAEHRVVVLRDIETPTDQEILRFCSELGEVMEWEFGAFNELKVDSQAKNYLYTKRAVPFHWDGAFVGRIPHFIFFHCVDALDSHNAGGETTFCDSVQLLNDIEEEERKRLADIEITYSTEKVVHYGGSFTSPLIAEHPVSAEPTIRYAEPVEDINPVALEVHGLSDSEQASFIQRMKRRLYDPSVCYDHRWRKGDIVIADNHALLHGRREFGEDQFRHLRRVNVL